MTPDWRQNADSRNTNDGGKPTGSGSSACAAMKLSSAHVIINADDWGHDAATTDRSLDCILRGAVSSVSAMVFMEDSERAADLARQHGIDAGLHLNLTEPFSARQCSSRLMENQEKLSRFLTSHHLAPVMYRPDLAASFEYVAQTQQEEYERLYGAPAHRVDGHLHMHLCTNVVYRNLLPRGVIVRRNFTFGPGEKGIINRSYRRWQDRQLARRYQIADFFFNLVPLDPSRLEKIFALGARFNVEVETHPIKDDEYALLVSGKIVSCFSGVKVARGYKLSSFDHSTSAADAI
jgi:predicted glycoside hydrolase/deacetylase ChbG (UPF0249 family)